MRVLLDTSVLVAAMVEQHPHHKRALPWLQRARPGDISVVVAAHSLAECYTTLTRLRVRPRVSPAMAWHLIQRNIVDTLEIVPFSTDDYCTVLEHLSVIGIIGGATYDALIAHAALKAKVDQLVTFNVRDFRRVYPVLSERIIEPD